MIACGNRGERLAYRLGLGPRSAVILVYHRVAELAEDPYRLAVPPAIFRAQMEYLASACHPLSLRELHQRLQDRTLPRRAVAITFDDGYADNLHHALPVLRDTGIPATIFVVAGMVDSGREFWWDALACLPGNGPADYTALRAMPSDRRDQILARRAHEAGGTLEARPTHRILDLEELRALDRDPLIEIGGHTLGHPQLSQLDPGQQQSEIAGGKCRLESMIGHEVTSFSYPFGGRHDFTAETRQIAGAAGYHRACANYPGLVNSAADRLALPRHLARAWGLDLFIHNLQAMFTNQPVEDPCDISLLLKT